MPKVPEIEVSLTETKHFERLVQFLNEVEMLAGVRGDEELDMLVEDCRKDMMGFSP